MPDNQRKSSRLRIVLTVTLIFVALYLTALFIWASNGTVATDLIQNGDIETSVNAEACIVRDEISIKSTITGSYIPTVEDGDKVAANSSIATVLSGSAEGLVKQLKSCELRILKALQKKSKSVDFFSKDIGKIDTDIETEIASLISAINNNNITQAARVREGINTLMQKRAEIIGGTSTSDPKINALKSERDRLKAQVAANRRQIYSPYSGVISYSTDGYEGKLKPNSVITYTPAYLDSIKNNQTQKSVAQETSANKPVAKIIKDISMFILAPVETKKSKMFGLGETIKVRINDTGDVISATVSSISKDYGGRTVISLKTDKAISATANLRKINVDIIKSSYSGYKVLRSSLKNIDEKNGTATIVLSKFNTAKFVKVSIIGQNDTYAIIGNPEENYGKGVNLYDSFVINPINISDGQELAK